MLLICNSLGYKSILTQTSDLVSIIVCVDALSPVEAAVAVLLVMTMALPTPVFADPPPPQYTMALVDQQTPKTGKRVLSVLEVIPGLLRILYP